MADILILLEVSLAVSAVGWKYFISLGYDYGVAALAVTMGVMYYSVLSLLRRRFRLPSLRQTYPDTHACYPSLQCGEIQMVAGIRGIK